MTSGLKNKLCCKRVSRGYTVVAKIHVGQELSFLFCQPKSFSLLHFVSSFSGLSDFCFQPPIIIAEQKKISAE